MTEDFCKRTERRTKKLGYTPKQAARLSKFCYVSMMSVCGMMGAMLDPSAKSMAGEEGESSLRLPMMVPSVENGKLTSHGYSSQSARASLQSLSSTIQRRLPAL
jgi:hypothetical protein